MNKEIAVRLIKYKRILTQLKSLGFGRVFSNNLGDAIGVSPALVRKDFSQFHLQGNKKGGYQIDELLDQLGTILGSKKDQEIIQVGCGNIGRALMSHSEFQQSGFRIIAGFDLQPENKQSVNSIPVYAMDIMESFIKEHNIEMAVMSVPESEAAILMERLEKAGISGILNFADVDLKGTSCCVVQNLNIGVEIEHLSIRMQQRECEH